MKNPAVIFFIVLFLLAGATARTHAQIDTAKTPPPVAEPEAYQQAISRINPAERAAALEKFIENYPASENLERARELLVASRVAAADEKLRRSEVNESVELFKLAITDAPLPLSEKLFTEIIIRIPTGLFFRGRAGEAVEIARLIEEKVAGDPKQLLGVASFYLGIEEAEEARRIARRAIEMAPEMPAAYQTLGLAGRINFDLPAAAEAYSKALELDPESIVSKRSLAEMKRATGESAEAIGLFREVLEKNPADAAARNGLVLALFAAGRRAEAETELTRTLEENPRNLFLLVGAAYWYAAHGEGAKAVEFAGRAVQIEPRYTWAQIALARGLLSQNRPLEAEKALLTARQYGNFPTLDYEIAAARLDAGLYREAVDELKKSFTLKDGRLMTYLGGRVFREADDFITLLEPERRASIFEPVSAARPERAARLKSLLRFGQEIDSAAGEAEGIVRAVDEFVAGEDRMRLHRQLFAAGQLLEKKIALPKALELTQAATGGIDPALEVPHPSAAVLADQIYEERRLAQSRNEVLIVPELPKKTLSKILRGRIEEITGWTLYRQGNPQEAVLRLRRAVSVFPEKSAWWRSGMWRMGAVLESQGKEKEALDAYISSYDKEAQSEGKRFVIEMLYRKLNGNLDGLDDLIGENPFIRHPKEEEAVAQTTPTPDPTPRPMPKIPDRVPVAEIIRPETGETSAAAVQTPPEETVRSGDGRPAGAEEEKPFPPEPAAAGGQTDEANMAEVVRDLKSLIARAENPPPATPQPENDEPSPVPSAPAEKVDGPPPIAEPADKPSDKEILPPEETSGEPGKEETAEDASGLVRITPAAAAVEKMTTVTDADDFAGLGAPEDAEKPADIPAAPDPSTAVLSTSAAGQPSSAAEGDPGRQSESVEAAAPFRSEPVFDSDLLAEARGGRPLEIDIPPKSPAAVPTPTPGPDEVAVYIRETMENISIPPPPADAADKRMNDDPEPAATAVAEEEGPPAEQGGEADETPPADEDRRDPAASTDSLFEPVIIKIPKGQTEEDVPANAAAAGEQKTVENETSSGERETVAAGAERPRVFVDESGEAAAAAVRPPPAEAIEPCTLQVSREKITLINNGGSMVVLVGIEESSDLTGLRASTPSPKDISIVFEPEIGGASGQAIFILRSTSERRGKYRVLFEAPCGKKEITVEVR